MNKLLAARIWNEEFYKNQLSTSQANLADAQSKFYQAATFAVIIIAVGVFIFLVSRVIRKK